MKKTNYSYVGIAFIILVFGIIFIPKIVDRFKQGDVVRNNRMSHAETNANTPKHDMVFLEIDGAPKKVPEFSFTNQNGDTITNKDYLGKVYIVEFFFTTCPTICPKMSANLIQIQDAFKQYQDFGVASFTINPDNDSIDVLKAYANKYGVTNPNWHLMTGEKEIIYELANKGFNIFAGENDEAAGGFEHSGNFALIDKNGYIRSRKDNFGNPKIFYNGIISEDQKVDDEGHQEEISILKQDIEILLNE